MVTFHIIITRLMLLEFLLILSNLSLNRIIFYGFSLPSKIFFLYNIPSYNDFSESISL